MLPTSRHTLLGYLRVMGQVTSMEMAMPTGFWLQDLQGRDFLEVRGVDASIILKESYKNRMGWCGQDVYGSG